MSAAVPAFKPLPFKTAQELVDAFMAGAKFVIVENGVFHSAEFWFSIRGAVAVGFINTDGDHCLFHPDGSHAFGGRERYLAFDESAKPDPFDAPMPFEQFAEMVGCECGDHYLRLVEMRGGCSCHISPPCAACSNPMDENEAARLGWAGDPESYDSGVADGIRDGDRPGIEASTMTKTQPPAAATPRESMHPLLVLATLGAKRWGTEP